MYKIYKYTNLINNKIYIGQTKMSLEERALNGHNYKGSTYFYNAIQKYGWENFKGEVLEEVETADVANEKEKYYIAMFDSTNPEIGYNITSGGSNCEIAESTKRLLSAKAKERYKNPKNNPMYGKKHSDDAIEKMRNIKLGENNPMYGKKMSYESRMKISETHMGANNPIHKHVYTEEERADISRRMSEVAKQWAKKVMCIEDNTVFDSITDGAKYYNVSKHTLSGHLHNKQHTCAGKHFKFVD